MKRKYKIIFLFLGLIIIFIILCVPFTNVRGNKPGEYQYCRYRLAVYEFWYIEAEGEGYPEESDTFIGKIILEKKIGGPLEYFGLKDIQKPTPKKL